MQTIASDTMIITTTLNQSMRRQSKQKSHFGGSHRFGCFLSEMISRRLNHHLFFFLKTQSDRWDEPTTTNCDTEKKNNARQYARCIIDWRTNLLDASRSIPNNESRARLSNRHVNLNSSSTHTRQKMIWLLTWTTSLNCGQPLCNIVTRTIFYFRNIIRMVE